MKRSQVFPAIIVNSKVINTTYTTAKKVSFLVCSNINIFNSYNSILIMCVNCELLNSGCILFYYNSIYLNLLSICFWGQLTIFLLGRGACFSYNSNNLLVSVQAY